MATNNKAVFDVAKPGKTPPSATSRPVISSHSSVIKDPMVADDTKDEAKADTPDKPLTPTVRKVITPPPEEKGKATDTADTTAANPDKENSQTKGKDAEGKKPDTKAGPSEAVINAVASQAAKRKKAEPTDEEKAQQLEIEKLIENKKYFVPIGAVSRRRRSRFLVILVIILLLAAAGGYLALDAGLIENNINLPFELIK